MLVLDDVDDIEEESQLMAYYVMPLNQITLLDHLQLHRDWYYLDAILNVGSQLLSIIYQIHETGYTYNNMKLENIMINNGKVTLVGFGQAVKIDDMKRLSVSSHSGSSNSYDSILNDTIKNEQQVQWTKAGPYNDYVDIYYMIYAELLKNNYSAFNHDEDLCEVVVKKKSELADPAQKTHPKNIYTYGSNLAKYLTVQAA